jgi:hypothetical protein
VEVPLNSLIDAIMKWLGYVPVSELVAANDRMENIQQKIDGIELQLINSTSSNGAANAEIRSLKKQSSSDAQTIARLKSNETLQSRCLPLHVELTPETPRDFYKKTETLAFRLLKEPRSISELCEVKKFHYPAQWNLYWTFALSTWDTASEARAPTDEDGLTEYFLGQLKIAARSISTYCEEDAKISIAFNAIFKQVAPAMKEAEVGADVLFLVSGKGLTPNGGVKLFWIQAKRAKRGSSKDAYRLDYRQKNSSGRQFDVLRKLHQPKLGSVAFYALYSESLPYIPAIAVGWMPLQAPKINTECVEYLDKNGARFSELVTAYTNAESVGEFTTSAKVLEFLNTVSSGVPLYVVMATSDDKEHRLLHEITDHYRQQLGLKLDLPRDRSRERDVGKGSSMDR